MSPFVLVFSQWEINLRNRTRALGKSESQGDTFWCLDMFSGFVFDGWNWVSHFQSRVQFVTLHYSFWVEVWCIFLGGIFVGVFTFFCFPPFFVTHADTTTSVCNIAKDTVHVKKKYVLHQLHLLTFSPSFLSLPFYGLVSFTQFLRCNSHLITSPWGIFLTYPYIIIILIPSCFHRTKFKFTWVTLLLYALGQSVV